ncbi:MAG: PP2C family protein-serine/threonine phosphatase [Jaaginema sp. PMC 1079.18]|nr:PP2C family protein-serine/threonine phosphatase [Jaaginema sp. PMC 1080.18]MEC4852898.1 PP2C family protein-serine/threonine phosphatase [Jaaginema sp. PMC 1079.18]MEC4868602.1 PP2C family protein-serine/threonine phosphatase [Jaaginema sp. PMC 1078.18]
MTAAPVPRHQPSDDFDGLNSVSETTPVSTLKELVARLHREQNKIQNLLSSLGFALRSFNNLNQFLELVPLMAARVTDADGGALVLFRPNGRVRLEQIHCQEGQACQDIRRAIEQAIRQNPQIRHNPESDRAAQSVTYTDLDQEIRHRVSTDLQLFGTPIWVKSQEQGRIYIFSHDPEYRWTTMRQKLVQLVADQTAVAIANQSLVNELRQKERLDRELEIASEIQIHLLPNQCPQIEGVELAAACQTANRVGGDYYDFIPTNYDRLHPHKPQVPSSVPWSIAIGDVMGKGVPAGLIMTMTRGMLRAEVLNRHTPARILQHLNRVMYDDLENSHRFVTLFYSEYDPQTRTLSYTNAAHNPPLCWRAATGKIERLDTWGMLIGLEADSQYEDAQVQLHPGDTVIYYTDGFTDAMNANGDRFDEENLLQSFQQACQQQFKPQQIVNYLFDRVQQFIGLGNRHGDDMTLVVLQVKST